MSVKSTVARKAATSVVKHTAHGTASKVKRQPARATRLLGLGALLGGVAGFLAGRRSSPAPSPVVHAAPAPRPAAPKPAPAAGGTSDAAAAVEAAASSGEDAALPGPD